MKADVFERYGKAPEAESSVVDSQPSAGATAGELGGELESSADDQREQCKTMTIATTMQRRQHERMGFEHLIEFSCQHLRQACATTPPACGVMKW